MDDKKQITGTFAVTFERKFLPIHFSERNCENVIVTHNLAKKLAEKAFIQNRYNQSFSNQIAIQLKRVSDPTDAKISSK